MNFYFIFFKKKRGGGRGCDFQGKLIWKLLLTFLAVKETTKILTKNVPNGIHVHRDSRQSKSKLASAISANYHFRVKNVLFHCVAIMIMPCTIEIDEHFVKNNILYYFFTSICALIQQIFLLVGQY